MSTLRLSRRRGAAQPPPRCFGSVRCLLSFASLIPIFLVFVLIRTWGDSDSSGAFQTLHHGPHLFPDANSKLKSTVSSEHTRRLQNGLKPPEKEARHVARDGNVTHVNDEQKDRNDAKPSLGLEIPGLRKPYLFDLRRMVNKSKLDRLPVVQRRAIYAAANDYQSSKGEKFILLDNDAKARIIDALAPALDSKIDEDVMRRFHLQRYAAGEPVYMALEFEERNWKVLDDFAPTLAVPFDNSKMPKLDAKQWAKLDTQQRRDVLDPYSWAVRHHSRDESAFFELMPGREMPEFFRGPLEVETPNSYEIKSNRPLRSLDEVYFGLSFLQRRYGEGAAQAHVSFGNAATGVKGHDPHLAGDMSAAIHYFNIASLLSQANVWPNAFTYKWLQMPKPGATRKITDRFARPGARFDAFRKAAAEGQPFKYVLIAPRDSCYKAAKQAGRADDATKGVELRRAPTWPSSTYGNGQAPYIMGLGRLAEVFSDLAVAGSLPEGFREALHVLPEPVDPWANDAADKLGDKSVEILKTVMSQLRVDTLVQGIERTEGFTDSALYGPWYPWSKLPFVSPTTKEKVAKRSQACIAEIGAIIDSSSDAIAHIDAAVGGKVNDAMRFFMDGIYSKDGMREDLFAHMTSLAKSLHKRALAVKLIDVFAT